MAEQVSLSQNENNYGINKEWECTQIWEGYAKDLITEIT